MKATAKKIKRRQGIKVLSRTADNDFDAPFLEKEVIKKSTIYGVIRVDNEISRTHGWLVTIQRRNVIYRRQFSDGVYGGRNKALSAAKAYRDEIIARHQPFSRREQAEIHKKNNTSGVVGVCRCCASETRQKPEEERRWFWVASWALPDGRAKRVKFSVRKYGEEGAFKMAVKARHEALSRMQGTFDRRTKRNKLRMPRS